METNILEGEKRIIAEEPSNSGQMAQREPEYSIIPASLTLDGAINTFQKLHG